jgi:anti-sigma regulatory factor (Ser/Thr protein kinase)
MESLDRGIQGRKVRRHAADTSISAAGSKDTVDVTAATGNNRETLSLRLAARPAQAPLLRAHLRIWLAEHHTVDHEILDILVAANEAFGNALRHAGQPRSIAVHVDAGISDGVVEIVVRDHGRWQEDQRNGDETGLGLALMHALMDSVELEASREGTTVRLRRVLGPHLVRLDRPGAARERIELLSRTPMFASLPQSSIERLASRLIPFSVSAEETIIREGEQGNLVYIVAGGELDVSVEGCHVATLGPDHPVGEIALLRDRRRTATIVAKKPAELYALTRSDFVAAIMSHDASRRAAEHMIATRLIGLEGVLGRSA